MTDKSIISGKLYSETAILELRYGFPGEVLSTTRVRLSSSNARSTDLVSDHWAGQKIAELSVFPEENYEHLLQLGRTHQMVTPSTSLIVMETLAQYVEHQFVRGGLADIRTKYDVKLARRQRRQGSGTGEDRTSDRTVENPIGMVEHKSDYPENFTYQDPSKQASSERSERATEEAISISYV